MDLVKKRLDISNSIDSYYNRNIKRQKTQWKMFSSKGETKPLYEKSFGYADPIQKEKIK